MKKQLFQDNYDHVSAAPSKPVFQSAPRKELWTDKRTGAQYAVQAKPANPADADFSDASKLAESRYRSIMGLSESTFHERPVDDPFAEDRLGPEPMTMHHEIEEKVRERARFDTKKMEATRPTKEPAESDIVDHGEYTVNARGQIRDKPKNTIGPYGTEEIRPVSKTTKEDSEANRRPTLNDRAQRNSAAQRPDKLEQKVGEHRGLQKALANAYKGLFGSAVADHIVHRSESTSAGRRDNENVSHVILEAGFMKPWSPPESGRDKNQKPDALIEAVGHRAIATLMKGPMKSELPDLPKADREALVTALGRTILHALTLAPESKDERSLGELKLKDELKSSMMNALSPEILRGLVPSEMLDSNVKKESRLQRSSAPAQKAIDIPSRRPNVDLEEGHSSRYAETQSREPKQNAEFGLFRKQKKTLFDFDHAA
jgi:hypothetical protein